jgi:hypothetical protein
MEKSRIKDVSALLSAFFDEEKLRRGGRYAQFFESWTAVVGERLAAHSRVVDLDKGILVVEAEHPGWIQLLQMRQTQTLDALAKRFPDLALRGIAFRLSGSDERSPRKPSGSDAAAAAPEEPGQLEEGRPDEAASEGAVEESLREQDKDPEFLAALSSLKKTIQGGKNK